METDMTVSDDELASMVQALSTSALDESSSDDALASIGQAFSTISSTFALENKICQLAGNSGLQELMSSRAPQTRELEETLESYPALVNCSSDYDYRYMTALERAVDMCDIEVVELLFAKGADPTNNTYDGALPTHASVVGNDQMQFMEEYPLGGGARADANVDTLPGYAGLYALCNPDSSNAEWKDRCVAMRAWLKRHRSKTLLKKLQDAVLMRSVAFYWLEKMMETTCAAGGAGRATDYASFREDFLDA